MHSDVSAIFINKDDQKIVEFCYKYSIPLYENIFGYHIYQSDLFLAWVTKFNPYHCSADDQSIFNDLISRI